MGVLGSMYTQPSPLASGIHSLVLGNALEDREDRKDRESRMGRLGFFQSPPKLAKLDKPLPTSYPVVAQNSSPLQGQHQESHLMKATLSPPHPSFLPSTVSSLFILTQVCLIGVWESPNERTNSRLVRKLPEHKLSARLSLLPHRRQRVGLQETWGKKSWQRGQVPRPNSHVTSANHSPLCFCSVG